MQSTHGQPRDTRTFHDNDGQHLGCHNKFAPVSTAYPAYPISCESGVQLCGAAIRGSYSRVSAASPGQLKALKLNNFIGIRPSSPFNLGATAGRAMARESASPGGDMQPPHEVCPKVALSKLSLFGCLRNNRYNSSGPLLNLLTPAARVYGPLALAVW